VTLIEGDDWQHRIQQAVKTLRALTPDEFYDPSTQRHHPVRRDIGEISQAFDNDVVLFKTLLNAANHSMECWLPVDTAKLESMSPMEIYCRLITNISGGRWVDAPLAKPFQSGSLARALEIIAENINQFELKSKPAL
jgi:hypothetical protein